MQASLGSEDGGVYTDTLQYLCTQQCSQQCQYTYRAYRSRLFLTRVGPAGSSCSVSSPTWALAAQHTAPCFPDSCQPFPAVTPIKGYKKPPAN